MVLVIAKIRGGLDARLATNMAGIGLSSVLCFRQHSIGYYGRRIWQAEKLFQLRANEKLLTTEIRLHQQV